MEKPFGLEGLEKHQAMWWEPPHNGYNCKMRAQGTGTTHATRKAQRAAKQWGYLEEVEIREEDLESHLEALEQAKFSLFFFQNCFVFVKLFIKSYQTCVLVRFDKIFL